MFSRNFREDVLISRIQRSRLELPAGRKQIYSGLIRSAKIPNDTPPGKYFLCATADPLNKVSEYKEEDNVTCHPIEVTPSSNKINKSNPIRRSR